MPNRASKKKQRQWYSGKKKRHTVKIQVVVNRNTKEIICVEENCGQCHDFKLYKESIGEKLLSSIKVQADSGYQGLNQIHKNSETPIKKTKSRKLTNQEKLSNKQLSKERILIENINAKIKVFKIMSNKYRNRRKRHTLRANLICGIINYESEL
jgi:hypothetical protein